MEKYRPGELVPTTNTYIAYDENDRDSGKLFLEKGKRFPATQYKGCYYIMDIPGKRKV